MKYLISVIVPNYNSGDSLHALMESLIKQSFQNFEVVIVDGLSDDHSLETAKAYQSNFKNRLKINSAKDQGIYDAMNKGIDRSSGSWLFFIGSNDYLFSESTFEEISRVLKNTLGNVVYGDVLIKGDTGWANDGDIYNGEFNLEKLLKKNICHQGIFYQKELFQNYGKYNISYPICADYDLNLRFFAKSKFEYTPVIVSVFSGGGASTSIFDEIFYRDKNQNLVKYFNFLPYAYLFREIHIISNTSIPKMLHLKCMFAFLRILEKWKRVFKSS